MKWLLIDVNYMCHRAFHSTGHLRSDDLLTGVVYGVLRVILSIQQEFSAEGLVWCFDSRKSDREIIYEGYKAKRKSKNKDKLPTEDRRALDELHNQIQLMRREYLPECGFRNVFCQSGKEADDLIAVIGQEIQEGDSAIIVSADHDLYQCLSNRVSIFHPSQRKYITIKSFFSEWGLYPIQWRQVKAIAGCSGDDVPGVEGVGEITAAKWLKNQLNPESVTFKKIEKSIDIIARNLKLVSLPLEGTSEKELCREDGVTKESWFKFLKRMHFDSLKKFMPLSVRRNISGQKRARKK